MLHIRIGDLGWCKCAHCENEAREIDCLCCREVNTRFWSYGFPQIFTIGGVSWTLNPSIEAVNCKIKLANNTFILVNILAYNNFMWTRNGVIVDIIIWNIKTYYSLSKSHLATQICTVSYVEYFVKFLRKYIWQSAPFKKVTTLNTAQLLPWIYCASFTKFSEHSCL